jgi:hypothetical protein
MIDLQARHYRVISISGAIRSNGLEVGILVCGVTISSRC